MLKKIGIFYFDIGWIISMVLGILWVIFIQICDVSEEVKNTMFWIGMGVLFIIGGIMFGFKHYT